jgi:DNA recombination protein RmuC
MDLLAVGEAGAVLLTAVLGYLLGRTRGGRLLEEAQAERLALRRRLAERDRDLAGLRARREQKIHELLEQLRVVEADRQALLGQAAALRVEREQLESVLAGERVATKDKLGLLNEATQKLETVFKALSTEALLLGRQNRALDEMIRPLQESLEHYDQEVRRMEQVRAEVYAVLRSRLEAVTGAQQRLQIDTGSFVQALIYERLTKLAEYFEELRKSLERSVPADAAGARRAAREAAALDAEGAR